MKHVYIGLLLLATPIYTYADASALFADEAGQLIADPNDKTAIGVSNAAIETISGESSATLKLSKALEDKVFSFALNAPINKGGDTSLFTVESGLKDYTSMTLEATFLSMPKFRDKISGREIHEACTTLRKDLELGGDGACDLIAIRDSLTKHPEKGTEIIMALRHLTEPTWFYGLSATGGYKKFTYYESVDATTTTDSDRYAWNAGFHFGQKRLYDYTWRIDYKVESKHEDSEPGIYCHELSTKCIQGVFGDPSKEYTRYASLTYKKTFGGTGTKAIKFEAKYDFEKESWSAELPYYFFGAPFKLNGGVKLAWSDLSGLNLGLFIGQTFSID